MRALYLTNHFRNAEEIEIPVVERPKPKIGREERLVRVHVSGVNQGDAKGVLGFFAHSKLPRILGRDFAGVLVEGGKKVWWMGGAAGIDFDGTQAEYLTIPEAAVAEIPDNLSILQAGAQTLPYVTAYYGLVSRAHIKRGETVLVLGALGKVGQAAMSICRWKKCKPIALVREKSLDKARALGWEATDTVPSGIDVVLNPLGDIYWEDAMRKMNKFGRMIVIGTDPKKHASLRLLPFYRANQDILGINSVDLDYEENAKILSAMKGGFESGDLVPLDGAAIYSMEQATDAYRAVLKGSHEQIVIAIAH